MPSPVGESLLCLTYGARHEKSLWIGFANWSFHYANKCCWIVIPAYPVKPSFVRMESEVQPNYIAETIGTVIGMLWWEWETSHDRSQILCFSTGINEISHKHLTKSNKLWLESHPWWKSLKSGSMAKPPGHLKRMDALNIAEKLTPMIHLLNLFQARPNRALLCRVKITNGHLQRNC